MKAKDFIKDKLTVLIDKFPQLKVRYEIDEIANSHFIEVLPKNDFKENVEYGKYETELIIDFIKEYPYDEIVFITKGDIIEISDPIFEKEGFLYDRNFNLNLFYTIDFNNTLVDINIKVDNEKLDDMFLDFISNDFYFDSSSPIVIKPIIEEPIELQSKDNDFSLAA